MYKKPNKKLVKPRAKQSSMNVKQIVRKEFLRQVEVKRRDEVLTLSPALSTGAQFQIVNPVPNGNLDFQRIGNTITCLSLQLKASITFPDSTNRVRLLIIQDKQCNGAVPVQADFLTFPLNGINSFINPDSRARFKIHHDKVYSGGAQGTVATAVNIYKKINCKTLYNNSTDIVSAITTNALYIVLLSDSSITPHPVLEGACRLRYTDA